MGPAAASPLLVNFRDPAAPEAVLHAVLARNPHASLQHIRNAHVSLQRVSLDQLAVRVSRALDRRADPILK